MTMPPAQAMNPQQLQAILKAADRTGWQTTQPVPELKMQTNPITGATSNVPTGRWFLNINDGRGNNQQITLRQTGVVGPTGEADWTVEEAPKELPKAPAAGETKTVGSDESGYYERQPDGTYKQVVAPKAGKAPNPDEDIATAVKRQGLEADRNMRQRNEASGKGYMTDAEAITFDQAAARLGLSADQNKLEREKFAQQKKQEDALLAGQVAQQGANLAKTGAETTLTGAQTRQVEQSTGTAAAKLPGELAQQEATLKSTEQATQIAGAPQVQAAPAQTQLNTYTRDPVTGMVTPSGVNPEFQAKTQTDIAARVGQLQTLANSKKAELQGKIGQNGYTADNAARDFSAWWDQNVESQKGALQAAQEQVQFARTQAEEEARRASLTSAMGAGTQAINAFQASQKGRVGDTFEGAMQAANRGSFESPEGAFTYQAPDVTDVAHNAVMDALKYISPTAAAATGAPPPNYGAMDVGGMLNRMNYAPGGASFMAPAPVGPTPGPVPVPPPPPVAPPWQRADQMFGMAPSGNQLAVPGFAGTAGQGSAVFNGLMLPDYQYAA